MEPPRLLPELALLLPCCVSGTWYIRGDSKLLFVPQTQKRTHSVSHLHIQKERSTMCFMQNHLFQAYCIDEREREANVLFTLKQSWPMYSISFLRVSCTSYKSTVVIDTLSLMSQTNPLPNSVLCPKIFLDSGSFSLLNHPNQALVMSHYLISIIQALPIVIILVVFCFLSSSLFCSSH